MSISRRTNEHDCANKDGDGKRKVMAGNGKRTSSNRGMAIEYHMCAVASELWKHEHVHMPSQNKMS